MGRVFITFLSTLFMMGCHSGSFLEFGNNVFGIEQFIVNGTRTPQTLELTEGQKVSIGFLADQSGQSYCTGTLIAARLVVTARHCVESKSASEIFFGLGGEPFSPGSMFPVVALKLHPTIDFSVLILGVNAEEFVPQVQ